MYFPQEILGSGKRNYKYTNLSITFKASWSTVMDCKSLVITDSKDDRMDPSCKKMKSFRKLLLLLLLMTKSCSVSVSVSRGCSHIWLLVDTSIKKINNDVNTHVYAEHIISTIIVKKKTENLDSIIAKWNTILMFFYSWESIDQALMIGLHVGMICIKFTIRRQNCGKFTINNIDGVVFQVKQKSVSCSNYQRARLAFPNHAFISSQKPWPHR